MIQRRQGRSWKSSHGGVYIGYVAAQRRNHKRKKMRLHARHNPAVALEDLPQLWGVRSWREWAKEHSGFVDKLGEGIASVLSAQDEVEGKVVTKKALAGARV